MVEQIMIMLKRGSRLYMGCKYLYLISVFSLIVFQSCSFNVNMALQNLLKDTDEVKIYLNKEISGNKSGIVIVITSKDTIQNILNSITNEDAGKRKCEYIGSLEFFHNKISLINMEFSLANGCAVIVFQYKGNIFRKVISTKGVELLGNYVYQFKN